jgi:hypothetical protein
MIAIGMLHWACHTHFTITASRYDDGATAAFQTSNYIGQLVHRGFECSYVM